MSKFLSKVERGDLIMGESRVMHSYGETFTERESAPFRTTRKSSTEARRARKRTVRTLRRLKGVLIELQSRDARVAFIEKGQTIFYDLPVEQLRRAGITVRNQPFQMDEIETQDDNGNLITGYRFLALAQPSDAYIETLNFDDERKRKRDLILKEFGKTQS